MLTNFSGSLCAAPGDTDGLVAVLGPLARMLRAGPKVSAEAGRSGLPPLLCELLKRPPALAALPLLQALRAIYEHHPRPKVSFKHTAGMSMIGLSMMGLDLGCRAAASPARHL